MQKNLPYNRVLKVKEVDRLYRIFYMKERDGLNKLLDTVRTADTVVVESIMLAALPQ